MAFSGVVAEEEGLGATLGGAGACFFVPKNPPQKNAIYKILNTVTWPNAGNSTGHGESFILHRNGEM